MSSFLFIPKSKREEWNVLAPGYLLEDNINVKVCVVDDKLYSDPIFEILTKAVYDYVKIKNENDLIDVDHYKYLCGFFEYIKKEIIGYRA